MTITHANTATFEVLAIPHSVVAGLLAADDAGHAPRFIVDEAGGSPLRCCLRRSSPGERIALVSYAPLRRWAAETGARPGPYDEVGPVFIHSETCGGQRDGGYPAEFLGSRRVLRAYSADGRILGGQIAEPNQVRDQAAAAGLLDEILADSRVALVHARAVDFGCFTFEIRRHTGAHENVGA
ncbi:MAG TPA: DUF1203 domain-containing protein [Streptosporangiaceae bacterium]|nr:DUF1203 domain-containing protein [Streptosporangiaceae bacterium]